MSSPLYVSPAETMAFHPIDVAYCQPIPKPPRRPDQLGDWFMAELTYLERGVSVVWGCRVSEPAHETIPAPPPSAE